MPRRSLVLVSCLALAFSTVITASNCHAAPFDPASLRNKGAAFLDNGDDVKAIEVFRDLVKRLPSSTPDRVNLGIALLSHNDLDQAEEELRKGLALDSRDPRAHYNLGLVLKRRGRNEEAAGELAKIVSTPEGARDASVHYNLGILYKRLRRNDEALAAFRSALALRPEHASAHFQIYNELVQRGDKAKAKPELDLFKSLQKATPDFQRTEAYLERGTFTRIAAPGPDGEGGSGDTLPASSSLGESAPIRFEVRLGANAGQENAGKSIGTSRGRGSDSTPDRESSRRKTASSPGGAKNSGNGGGKPGSETLAARSSSIDVAAALVDLDGDGVVELAVGDAGGRVQVLRQKAPGIFPSTPDATPAPSPQGTVPEDGRTLALAAGDADNDGDLDIVASSAKGVRLFLNDGKGRLADATRGTGLEGAGGASELLWLDVDRDGDLDLILGGGGSNDHGPRLYLNASAQPDVPESTGDRGPGTHDHASKSPSSRSDPRFLPAGPEASLPACGEELTFSDLRGRDDPDVVFLCADGSIQLGRNLRAGRFQAERAGIVPSTSPAAGEDGTRPDSAPSGTPTSPGARAAGGGREVLATDLDGDGRNDVMVLAGGSLSVLWGEAEGQLALPRTIVEGVPRGAADLALLDADGDGDLDVATLVPAAASSSSSSASGTPPSSSTTSSERSATSGRLESGLGSGQKARLWVLRNEGRRRFTSMKDTAAEIPAPGSLLMADVDQDGDPDLVAVGGPGSPSVSLLNVTKSANRFLRIALAGGKSNKFGVGAKVEVRAGRLVVRRESNGSPLLVGVGARGRIDAVQIVWPTGVSQDFVDVPATALKVEEKREFAGSCPFLYVRDETGFRFIGEALSGAPIGFLRPDGLFERPRPTEHLRLPPGLPVARDGRLSIRLTEEMRELTALDSVRLVAVDHPVDTEVYSNERLRESQEPFRYLALKELVPPSAAAEVGLEVGEVSHPPLDIHEGALRSDVPVSAVRTLDDRAADGFATLGPRLEGFAVPHALVLRFDEIEEPGPKETLALVVDGWVSWSTSDVSRALFQAGKASLLDSTMGGSEASAANGTEKDPGKEQGAADPRAAVGSVRPGGSPANPSGNNSGPGSGQCASFAGRPLPTSLVPWGPALEVRIDEARSDEPDLGLPLGPSMVAPLPSFVEAPGRPAGAPIEIRIASNQAIYYDRIRLGRIVGVSFEIHELAPIAADLRWRGVAASRRHEDAEPTKPDYGDVSPLSPFARLGEQTTPTGDVLARVTEPDGRTVIFGTGEEVAVDFDATSLPAPASGLTRTWFLVSRGYARDGDPNTEPLPWGE